MKRHLNISITGLVQGVFFRYSTQREAEKLDLKGIVRNQSDGTVYIEAEGNQAMLDKLIAWCHKGPTFARVDKVVIDKGKLKNYPDFKII